MSVPLMVQFEHELVFTVLISVFSGAAMWPIRKITKAYSEVKTSIEELQTELTTQRTNCLATLQTQGAEQIVVLKECATVLRDMHTDQKILLDRLER